MTEQVEVVRFEIAKLELQPGDSLLVKTKMILSRDQMVYIEAYFKRYVGDDVKVIVIGSDMDVEVLRPKSPEPEQP